MILKTHIDAFIINLKLYYTLISQSNVEYNVFKTAIVYHATIKPGINV